LGFPVFLKNGVGGGRNVLQTTVVWKTIMFDRYALVHNFLFSAFSMGNYGVPLIFNDVLQL
jgi:hypothetical protein